MNIGLLLNSFPDSKHETIQACTKFPFSLYMNVQGNLKIFSGLKKEEGILCVEFYIFFAV